MLPAFPYLLLSFYPSLLLSVSEEREHQPLSALHAYS